VWCLEWLQWGLGNCESVRQADCVETLDCRGDLLVQECRFTRVGGAQRSSRANYHYYFLTLVLYSQKRKKCAVLFLCYAIVNNNNIIIINITVADYKGASEAQLADLSSEGKIVVIVFY